VVWFAQPQEVYVEDIEKRRKYQREFARAARAKRKALGLPPPPRRRKERTPEEIERQKERGREWYAKNREDKLAKNAAWREANADRQRELVLEWQRKNRERVSAKTQEWRERNLDHARALARKNAARLRATPWGNITMRIFGSLRQALRKGGTGVSKYNAYLGYTWAELHAHIEAQFTPEMTWGNWGPYWELDHIKPLSSFRYETLDCPLFREAWALSNIRPLERTANRRKFNRPE
jgi:hypothetical protein